MKKEIPTPTVDFRQARTQFSRLLARVARGEEILITRAGQPMARLVPCPQTGKRQLGMDAGRVMIAADFDGGLPDAALADFER